MTVQSYILTRCDFAEVVEMKVEEYLSTIMEAPRIFSTWEAARDAATRDWAKVYEDVADDEAPTAPPLEWTGDVAPVTGAVWEAQTDVPEIYYRITLAVLE